MHLQPIYRNNEIGGGAVSESLFPQGFGTAMEENDMSRVIYIVRGCWWSMG